jgi:1-acyl-sn-glycerol-3-phosphate acyltransferase
MEGTMASLLTPRDEYRTEPDTWQTQWWARAARRIGRHWVIDRHVKRFCRPLTIDRDDTVRTIKGPALVIANHGSHFDTPVVLSALPERIRCRTAVAAAADRFYRNDKRGWWYSLYFNTFPIDRQGGGAATLQYPLQLLEHGWSVLIYPEGTRTIDGTMGGFHHGAALLALRAQVPVIPVHTEGLRELMPKGQRTPRPAPAYVKVGAPLSLDDVGSVPEATAALETAMRYLAAHAGAGEAEPRGHRVAVA